MSRARPPLLRVEDLTYAYPDGTVALRGVSLEIEAGERVAVLGANGSGKSTLLLHAGAVLHTDGALSLFGERVSRSNVRRMRRRVGILFQDPDDQLFCPTVFEDVAFGPRNALLPEEEVRRRVEEALAEVGLPGAGGRCAFHMSLGEKKRVALACVLAMRPELLLLDEPTANLDPRGRRELTDLLAGLPGTMLLATHDLGLARRLCGRAVILVEGGVAADGPIDEVLGSRDRLLQWSLA